VADFIGIGALDLGSARFWPDDWSFKTMEVDLILLSRDLSPPRADVSRGIQLQGEVDLRIHRLEGTSRLEDPNRYETIARARNQAKTLGTSPWVMFLDDDVVLGPGCVGRLVQALPRKNGFAALGADSSGEMAGEWENWDYPRHVGMAATLFRRERLERLTFRWEPGKCECRCCCDDLRGAGFGIGYLAQAKAWHRPSQTAIVHRRELAIERGGRPGVAGGSGASTKGGRILTAFDRNHFSRFRRQFLTTLRASGNREPLTAVTYGLQSGERRMLEAAGVEVVARNENGVSSALRRLRDFQDVVERWPEDTPVAYWDAGDVLFQGTLAPLWEMVRADPGRLHVVREPVGTGESPVIVPWTDHIEDPVVRRQTRELLAGMPFINAGFAAGSVRALMGYLREGDRLLHNELKGVLHWGDQVAMGHYLHHNPDVWREISDGWNFCIIFRRPGTYRIGAGGRVENSSGAPVHVVHGNGRTLGPWVMSFVG
jgi:hypothetical protein